MTFITFCSDDLPVAPGMSKKLKIIQNDQNTTTNINATSTAQDEWADDVIGFWDDEVPEIVKQPDATPESILVDEIGHIKVMINLKKFSYNHIKSNFNFIEQ